MHRFIMTIHLAAPPHSPPTAGSPQKPLSAMAQLERLADGGLAYKSLFPTGKKNTFMV